MNAVQVEVVEVQLLSRFFAPGKRCSSGFLLGLADVNSFQAIAPLTGQKKGYFFRGAYLHQILDPNSNIETQRVSVQTHVLSYIYSK
jgi:hypothetical protein